MPEPALPGRRGGAGRDRSPVLRRAPRGADHPRIRRHSAHRARRAERRRDPGHPGGVHQPARTAGPGKPAAAARHGGDAGPDQAPDPRAARLTPPSAAGRITAYLHVTTTARRNRDPGYTGRPGGLPGRDRSSGAAGQAAPTDRALRDSPESMPMEMMRVGWIRTM